MKYATFRYDSAEVENDLNGRNSQDIKCPFTTNVLLVQYESSIINKLDQELKVALCDDS